MRKYYSDYVRHCARYYFSKDLVPRFEERVNYNNYISVSNVLDRYPSDVFNMIRFVYSDESMPRAVDKFATDNNIKPEQVWYNIQRFEKDVAVERGLL